MATDGSVSAARNRGRLDISYHAGASRGRPEAGTYVCCWCGVVRDVEGAGGGLPVRRHSYRGNRVELSRIADWLKSDKNSSKSSRVDNSGVPGLYPTKAGTMRLDQLQSLWGAFFTSF